MTNRKKNIMIAFTFPLAIFMISVTESQTQSVFTISDDRIRNIDSTPVLGRGYSIMTNSYQSTCLVVGKTSTPSFNYNFDFDEYAASNLAELETAMSVDASRSMGYGLISTEFSQASSTSTKTYSQTHIVTSSMRIERYYSSVKEETSYLSADAFALLDSQDYVGFFKSCGPNYVRGIRRAQEVMAIFSFQTQSRELATQFSSTFKMRRITSTSGVTASSSLSFNSKFKSMNKSLRIRINGWGVGLTKEGSEAFIATTLEEYEDVMEFAFRSMTNNEDAHNIGMVHGIEVIPWTHNTAFQVAAKLSKSIIEIPIARSLIPKAIINSNGELECKNKSFQKDKYNYCCEYEQLYNPGTGNYIFTELGGDASTSICKPVRALDPTLVKDNMSNNAEFVARLDAAMRYRLTSLATLTRCVSTANSIPDDYNFNILKAKDQAMYDKFIGFDITLVQLKMAIDPTDDYRLVKHMTKELDEWIEMFLTPCYGALYGTNVGFSPDLDVSYFMAYPWYKHKECMHLTCLTNTMRWNQGSEGGCVPSVIAGTRSAVYDKNDNYNCARDGESYQTNDCKHNTSSLDSFQENLKDCLEKVSMGNLDYLLSQFCMPQLTNEKIDPESIQTLQANINNSKCRD